MSYLKNKKKALMSISPNVVHISKNDIYPLHLHNCIEQSLQITKIYGNSVQASEPTDLTPVPIESTGFKNLFDDFQLLKALNCIYGTFDGKDDTYACTVGTCGASSISGYICGKFTGLYTAFGENTDGYNMPFNNHQIIISYEAKNKSQTNSTTYFQAINKSNNIKSNVGGSINHTDWQKHSGVTTNIPKKLITGFNLDDIVYLRHIQVEETDVVTDYTPCYREREVKISENLFDSSQLLNATGWTCVDGVYSGSASSLYIKYSYAADDNTKNGYVIDIPELGEYECIEISYDGKNGTKNALTSGISIRYDNDSYINISIDSSTYKTYKFKSALGAKIKAIYAPLSSEDTIYMKNINIKKYNYSKIKTDGIYKLPIGVMGKNLLRSFMVSSSYTTNGITFTKKSDESITINGTASANAILYMNYPENPLYLRQGETYYLYNSGYTYNDGIITCLQSTNYKQSTWGGAIKADYSTYYLFIRINKGTVCDNIVIRPQLEVGSSFSETEQIGLSENYMIYLDQPLRSIGDTRDYIDYESGKLIRYIYEGKIDGSENIEMTEVSGNKRFTITVPSKITSDIIYDRKFDYTNVTKDNTNSYITIGISGYETVDDFKTYLKSSPIQYLCKMEQSTEESIELPKIPLIKRHHTITPRCTGVKPLIDLRYYKN